MLAKRLPLVLAFASGGVASAAAIGFSNGSSPSDESSVVQSASADDASASRVSTPSREPALTRAPASDTTIKAQPITTAHPAKPSGPATTESSEAEASVADILARLEAEYRQRLVADPVDSLANEPAPAETIALAGEPSPAIPKQEAPAAAPPAPSTAPEPATAVPPAHTPDADMKPVAALTDAVEPRAVPLGNVHQDIHVGDVNQNTHVTTVNQTEVVVVQQQLALLQYFQLLAPRSDVRPRAPAPRRPTVTTRRSHSFSLPLTNPDNPWGFDFPPTVLAK